LHFVLCTHLNFFAAVKYVSVVAYLTDANEYRETRNQSHKPIDYSAYNYNFPSKLHRKHNFDIQPMILNDLVIHE